MLNSILKAVWYGLKIGAGVLAIAAALAFLTGPTLFGAVIITSSAAVAVLFWTVLSFAIASTWRFIRGRKNPQ